MAVSIFHVGLPLDHPAIPIEERPKITKRLSDLQQRMRDAGYNYEIVHYSPETGLDGFKQQLRTQPCDGVLIGGGVSSDPAMIYFMEQIINAAHEAAPQAKIMFFDHSLDVRVTRRTLVSTPIRRTSLCNRNYECRTQDCPAGAQETTKRTQDRHRGTI